MTQPDKNSVERLAALIRDALNFCNAAAGEGLEIDGLFPEEFLMRFSDATGFEDWDNIGDHVASALQARFDSLEREVASYHDAYEGEKRGRQIERDALQARVDALTKLDMEYGKVESAIIMADRDFDGDSDHADCGERLIDSVQRIADQRDAAIKQRDEALAASGAVAAE